MPKETPKTTPLLFIVAIPVETELHVPSVAALFKDVETPMHIEKVPVILPALGREFVTTVIAAVVKAPVVVSALPFNTTSEYKCMAALLLTIVPLKTEESFMFTDPLTTQNTFFACVPFIRITFERTLVDRAPFIRITNVALVLPSAFRKTESVNVVAAFRR